MVVQTLPAGVRTAQYTSLHKASQDPSLPATPCAGLTFDFQHARKAFDRWLFATTVITCRAPPVWRSSYTTSSRSPSATGPPASRRSAPSPLPLLLPWDVPEPAPHEARIASRPVRRSSQSRSTLESGTPGRHPCTSGPGGPGRGPYQEPWRIQEAGSIVTRSRLRSAPTLPGCCWAHPAHTAIQNQPTRAHRWCPRSSLPPPPRQQPPQRRCSPACCDPPRPRHRECCP